MQEQELFQDYELKNWELSPRIYKILGVSAIVNVFLFGIMAQANVLTAKSCDTPFVSGVCKVLDSLYVGSMIFDTETGYINEDYVKTELEDVDITFLDLTGQTPPLEYPDGYFAVANPEQQAEVLDANNFTTNSTTPGTYIPGITGNTNPTYNNKSADLTTKAQVTPTPNKKPVTGKVPTGFPTDNQTTATTTTKNQNKKNPTTTTDNSTTAQTNNQSNPTTQEQKVEGEKVNEANINKKVLKDYASYVKAKKEVDKLDLNQPFKVFVEGVLTKDGKFDISKDNKTNKPKTQFFILEGDPQMADVAKKALEAVGDSGWLIYLRNLGAEKFKITLVQDGEKIFARVESELKDENKAKSVASGLNTLFSLTKNNATLDEDARILMNGAQPPTSNGNICIIDFAIPKADAQAMIERNLNKVPLPTPATTNQTKSTAQTDKNNQTTGK